ncbi:aldehyde dehydrogenase family 7 member A1-like isoform X1 [Vitis riparia]|uniref:aldehyde dehydrogenase family 7 member A1-like isoform X1 n=1 Tax=Vitis riparia TaxID=96939 RepID=UPI00155AC57A|nr:aldehyde dehydrogenase family 7 member A1-like isoform X1 [Vitis riparia]XP_034696632.1 aldehyde dehydrogenase family 7 member A1-like isoform X1 [Vitis riparia]
MFARSEYMFLSEIDLSVVHPGYYVNGKWKGRSSSMVTSVNPVNNETIAAVTEGSIEDYEEGIQACSKAAKLWMKTPVSKRCEIVRQIGDALRAKLQLFGRLVSLEVGKILVEGIGEVQEVIDMCDYAAGLSEKLNLNASIRHERQNHVTLQVRNPFGVVGVITPFNFPCAVLGRNACMALVTGNCVVWKGSRSTPLVTIAITKLVAGVLKNNNLPGAIFTSFCGGAPIGQAMAEDKRIPLVSFTGTSKVGLMVQQRVNDRFGKCLLELSGNNAITVMGDADIPLVVQAVLLDAVGIAGQCRITCHRLFIQETIYELVIERLLLEYTLVTIGMGDPLKTGTLLGPLHTKALKRNFRTVMQKIKSQGGKVFIGDVVSSVGNFVRPTIVEISPNADVVKEELFVPVLYAIKFTTFEEAMQINNSISPGSSNSIFTRKPHLVVPGIRHTNRSLGIDCGIVNVNLPTRGRGGAGSDSWEQYTRRTICTINYGDESSF